MKKNILLLCIIILSIFITTNNLPAVSEEDVVVIVNSSKQSPSRVQIQQIFTGLIQTWPDGSPVKVLLNSDPSIYDAFANKYLSMSARRVDNVWVAENVRNGTPVPRKVNSTVIKMMVANSSMFIGFVRKSEMKEDVKAVE